MKRFLTIVLLVAVVASGVFAQSLGGTWYDPQDAENALFPTSILNYTTNGIMADEFDYIVRAPLMLSNYEGYGIFTAYGNYEALAGNTNWTNPFDTTGLTSGPGNEIDLYQLGATFPFLSGMRAGAVVGYSYLLNGNITGGLTADESSTTDITDLNTLGQIDFTQTTSYSSVDKTTESSTTLLTGASLGDLGFGDLGVSFLFSNAGTTRSIGGSYSFAWTLGTDAAVVPADQVTSDVRTIGYGTDGSAANYGSFGTMVIGALGQLSLGSMPVFAGLTFTPATGPLPVTNVRADTTITTAYVTAAGGAATDVTTQTVSQGVDLSGGAWSDPSTVGTDYPLTNEPGTPYVDPSESSNGSLTVALDLGAEPEFVINETLTFQTKGQLSLSNLSLSSTYTYSASATESAATTAAANSEWSYSYTEVAGGVYPGPASRNTFAVGVELGGIAKLSDDEDIVSLGVGFFATPEFTFRGATLDDAVTTTVRSFTDPVGATEVTLADVNALLPGLAAAATVIQNGGLEGTSTYTSTTTYADGYSDRSTSLDLDIPVSVSVNLFEGKLMPFFGYTINHTSTVTTSTTPSSTTTESLVVTDSTGAEVFNSGDATDYPPGQSVASSTGTDGQTTVTSTIEWAGQMGWGLRWMPTDSLTIDIEGQSVMTALNGLGFNDFKLDDLLGMDLSVSFRF